MWELTTYFPRKTLESAIKSIILVYVGYAFYIWDVSVQMIEKNISISDYFQSVIEEIRTNHAKKTMTRTTVTIFLLFLNNLCSILYNLIFFFGFNKQEITSNISSYFFNYSKYLKEEILFPQQCVSFLWQNVEANKSS